MATIKKIANSHIFGVNSKKLPNFEKSWHSFQTTKLEKRRRRKTTQ
jgi:hypothetical protein